MPYKIFCDRARLGGHYHDSAGLGSNDDDVWRWIEEYGSISSPIYGLETKFLIILKIDEAKI